MKIPLSWLKDYIDVNLPLPHLAHELTMCGLEVDEVELVGLPAPQDDGHGFKFTGITWQRDKFVVAEVREVMPHPNADRLVLCRLFDGTEELVVLTGAPNLYPYKDRGALAQPLKVAYAREGAQLYDGHQPGQVLTTLKRTKIRGVESFSMVCSEKELGISEEHEGVIILDPDAPTGMPLVDYMGDAVFEISILPNMIRNACVVGVARELAAQLDMPLKKSAPKLAWDGPSIEGQVYLQISDPELNPRFVLGLLRGVTPGASPYWVQRRLRLAGMRPISNVVDATNYAMLALGEPLHAFDYDVLVKRAGGKPPTIITRTAKPGEKLTTLDDVERDLNDHTILVCDGAGALSLAGVMGGLESEVTPETRNVLLEGASWNFINIRRTSGEQRLLSEASYRFSRGIHPALAQEGVELCLGYMAAWSGGEIAAGLVDAYPNPPPDAEVELSAAEVRRGLGIQLTADEMATLLRRLEFTCTVQGESVFVKTPPHRLDIGSGLTGKADLLEELARLYGYDNIPATRLGDELPPQRGNPLQEKEELLRDMLVRLGLQETVTYRLTSPEREARLLAVADAPYVRLANPIAAERTVMRRSLLASTLEVIEKNNRLRERLAIFEIGPVFLPQPDTELPVEQQRLTIALTGLRLPQAWDQRPQGALDFYDMKGILEALFTGLHVERVGYQPLEHPVFHPGKCAAVQVGEQPAGVLGELHPQVKARYDFGNHPVLAAELDLGVILGAVPFRYDAVAVPAYPPALEDLAVIVPEETTAQQVAEVIRQGGGKLLVDLQLFDIYRGAQIGAGKKSLAYKLTYQAQDHTLKEDEVRQARNRIIRRLEQALGASLRA
ncbi:MAG: phenylalanine--tRNA ligase subunit beta [Anaerolineae bacterium]|nr:phenylalanine--tRNA ligase subunit beta [Anaerolineae bacterium]